MLDHDGRCQDCGSIVPVRDIRIEPGPGYQPSGAVLDPVSAAINTPHRLLEPVTAARAGQAAR